LKNALAAGLVFVLILSACGGLKTTGGQTQQPQFPTAVKTAGPASPTPAGTVSTSQAATPQGPAQGQSCADAAGIVDQYKIPWKGELLTGRIYLPPCYGQDPEREYPTLYMLHGATETDDHWDEIGLDEMADGLISRGEIPPLIIIMPKEITWIVLPDNPFGDHLIKAVIPWIDSHYKTRADREYRAIGGMSRGGNWAVRLGLLHWGMFGAVGAHSTPLFIGDLQRVPGWVEIIPPSQTPRIWMDIGQADNNMAEAKAFHRSLVGLDIPHEWRIYPGLHDEQYWGSHLEEYLQWYSMGWTED
jgi:enterochelin esterase-like enzyme